MPTWISLLRAVNLGARNQLSMPALRGALAGTGFGDVTTYLQSGNLVTSSRHRTERGVAARIREVLSEEFEMDVPVIVRSPAAMARVVDLDPFPVEARREPRLVQVVFFCDPLGAAETFEAEAAKLGERVVVHGRELYVAYSGRGVHTSRLTSGLLRKRFGQDGTARNWRTVTALVERSS